MSEETTTPEGEGTTEAPAADTEKSVPYERFEKVNKQAKEAKAERDQMRKDMADLKAQMDERETAGLPELERERKRAEQLEKRATEAEKRADAQEKAATKASRERLVLAAAASAAFDEADDALRYPEYVNLDEIESASDAERAVKRLAKARPKLLKAEEPKLPGRVLQNGQAAKAGDEDPKAGLGQELLQQFFGGR